MSLKTVAQNSLPESLRDPYQISRDRDLQKGPFIGVLQKAS